MITSPHRNDHLTTLCGKEKVNKVARLIRLKITLFTGDRKITLEYGGMKCAVIRGSHTIYDILCIQYTANVLWRS